MVCRNIFFVSASLMFHISKQNRQIFPAGFLCSLLNVNWVLHEGPEAYFHDPFTTIGIASSRFSFELHTPTENLTTFQKGPLYFGSKVFNYLPTNIKNISRDIKQFRSTLKNFFLYIHFTRWRNILLAIPIEISVQCNYFISTYLNNLSRNITDILLFLI